MVRYKSIKTKLYLSIHEKGFSGKCTKRGLYVSQEGIKMNADLYVVLSIDKKSNTDAERTLLRFEHTQANILIWYVIVKTSHR